MSMMSTYNNITRDSDAIRGREFVVRDECMSNYAGESILPSGTVIVADFAGDFGMYGLCEINGVLKKVKIPLEELHNIDFGDLDAR